MKIGDWLGLVFVVLKLCGVIDWSWWWVTAPWWGTFVAATLIFVARRLLETPHQRFLRELQDKLKGHP